MTYEEALSVINARLQFGIKPGLERVAAVLERLGEPQKKLKFVHVAGTNGKGTTCTLISSVLRRAGYRTGLYTSPYVLDFRERFQIDGEMISPEELIEEVERVAPAVRAVEAAGETVTEFEFITALALDWFARRGCDLVVLEVGLGGRFDATNVIDTPEVAVITSISLDHTAILGDTLEQIAFEKGGVIKAGGRVVLYPEQGPGVTEVLQGLCRERGAALTVPDLGRVRVTGASIEGTSFTLDGAAYRTPFLGEHQVKNAVTALAALEVLKTRGFALEEEQIRQGMEEAFLPARMEILHRGPLCLLDGGHNPGCAAALKDALERFVPGRRVAILGIMADKDSREYLRLVGPLFEEIFTLAPDNPRAMDARELAEVAREFCPRVTPVDTVGEALARSMKDLGEEDSLIVCGSFYLAGEIREGLRRKFAVWG